STSRSLPSFETTVVEKFQLADDVMCLRLSNIDGFEYHAGQFVNIYKDERVSRSYSLASVPGVDAFLEFHIKLLPNGLVSSWVHDDLKPGDTLKISDAKGNSFYINDDLQKDMLLIGTGTGLAPLYGVIRDALKQGHTGQIHLYHGSRDSTGLYLVDELHALAAAHENLHYVPCVSGESSDSKFVAGRANELALEQHKAMKGWRVFLCGNPDMIEKTKLKVYLAGASLNDILTDPFVIGEAPIS
ncbi:MAG: FAD-binding oxidoreductase, partial [Gammaproteobacteria bacterium]|nr:FAD-binding oxidoreductase [Gammaproteobacteria bacterium]